MPFDGKKWEYWNFQECFVICDLKIGRYRKFTQSIII